MDLSNQIVKEKLLNENSELELNSQEIIDDPFVIDINTLKKHLTKKYPKLQEVSVALLSKCIFQPKDQRSTTMLGDKNEFRFTNEITLR